jgi:hypothetical protein
MAVVIWFINNYQDIEDNMEDIMKRWKSIGSEADFTKPKLLLVGKDQSLLNSLQSTARTTDLFSSVDYMTSPLRTSILEDIDSDQKIRQYYSRLFIA